MGKYYEWHVLPGEEELEEVYFHSDRGFDYPVASQFFYADGTEMIRSRVLETAEHIKDWNPKNFTVIKYHGEIRLDTVASIGGTRIVSRKAAGLIERFARRQVQKLPITLRFESPKTRPQKGYFIINPLSLVDCLDLKKTKSRVRHGVRYASPHRDNHFLQESKIDPALKIFRLEYSRGTIVVSDEFVEYILSQDVRGFRFDELNLV